MLRIKLNIVKKNAMLRKHSRHMVKLIKRRLAKPDNCLLSDYFSNDKRIKEVIETESDKLLDLNERILVFLKSRHSEGDIEKAIQQTFSETYFFSKTTPKYNAYHFCEKLGLFTCPYCNVMPIPTVITQKPKEFVARPPLDHFYANTLYPMLAISFHNLVPCCDTCNSRLKLAKPTHHLTHLNPHVGEFADEFIFELSGFRKIDDVLSKKARFNIKLKNVTKDIRFEGNEALFHLNTMYSVHKNVSHSCLVKARNYSPAMLRQFESIAKSSSMDDYFLAFDSNFALERLHEHPLSKLKRDIISKYANMDLKTKLGI